MNNSMQVLDHGYVKLVESWGSDERIIEAARMSTDKGFEGWGPTCKQCGMPEIGISGSEYMAQSQQKRTEQKECDQAGHDFGPGDEKLLKFLWDNKHATPFEMGGLVIEVMAPIFVFREWHRHRTQSYNEMSARYTPLPDVNYMPTIERLMMNAGTSNKQAGTVKGSDEMTTNAAEVYRDALKSMYTSQEKLYQGALAQGVPKELARVHLPVGRYSRMRASANLRNWLGFLTLRMDKAAQYEIRQYANAVGTIVAEKFPRTWALFSEGAR